MESLDKLSFVGFLLLTMLSLGMRTQAEDLREMFASKALLARTLFANFVVAPLLGLAIVRIVPLPSGSAQALLILACVPGGLTAVKFTRTHKGEEALAGALVLLLSALAVFVSPVILRIMFPGAADAHVPYLRILGAYAMLLLAPLAAGMLVGDRSPRLSAKLSPVLGILGTVLFLIHMVVTKSFRKEAVASIGGTAVGCMVLFILGTMAAGWLLGGPQRPRRMMLASTTSVRNVALAMVLAHDSPAAPVVIPSILAFSLLMVTPNTILNLGSKLWGFVRTRWATHSSKA